MIEDRLLTGACWATLEEPPRFNLGEFLQIKRVSRIVRQAYIPPFHYVSDEVCHTGVESSYS